mgnify:FL=1
MQLTNIHILEATLILETGLHIGGGDSEIHIGGIDNEVIKHPVSGEPYIPGSSLKGKIRSLLEWKSGAVQEAPLGKKEYDNAQSEQQAAAIKQILQLFGISGDTADESFQKEIGHTRVSFWDCPLNRDYVKRLDSDNLPLTEAKSENRINRIAGTADPRQTERVPAGARFDFKLTIKEFDGDDKALFDTLLQGLKLLEWDSLGGNGSRGYGKVAFTAITRNGEDISSCFAAIQPFAK